jgi:hypothetical protein
MIGSARAPKAAVVFRQQGARYCQLEKAGIGMRNPDQWSPMEPEDSGAAKPLGGEGEGHVRDTRRGALAGLIIVVLLIAGGLVLTRVLRGMSQLQDCALSGRSNCT